MRNWQDELREALIARHGEDQGLTLASRYGRALPAGYIERSHAGDRRHRRRDLAALRYAGRPAPEPVPRPRAQPGEGALRFKLYRQHSDIPLSDALPMMENMGLRVISEHPYRIELPTTTAAVPVYIQDFEVEAAQADLDVSQLDADFEDAFAQHLARRRRERRLQPPDPRRRPRLAPGRDAARLLQVPAADRRAVLAEPTWKTRSPAIRCWRACWSSCSRPASIRAPAARARPQIESGAERFAQQLQALAGGDAATITALQPVIEARRQGRDAQYDSDPQRAQGAARPRRQPRRGPHPAQLHQRDRRHAAHQLLPDRRRRQARTTTSASSSIRRRCRICPSRARIARSSSTARAWKACTCASARSRAAACAGRTGARISAPRCWAWSRRRWSRTR